MTHKPPIGGVVSHRYAAPGALRHIAAFTAEQHTAAAAAIQKENALFAAGKVFLKFFPKHPADKPRITLPNLLPKIRYHDLGQSPFVISAAQQKLVIASLLRGPGSFHGWCGGTQQQSGIMFGAKVFCHIPGVIPGRIFRLVAALLFFIHDNETQVFQRRENRRAGTQHHPDLSPSDAFPLVIALCHMEGAMEHGHIAAEVRGELPHHLRRQYDLWH